MKFSSLWALVRWIKDNPGKSLQIDQTIFDRAHLEIFVSLSQQNKRGNGGGGRHRILTEEQQAEIFSRWESGESQRKIARDYGCSHSTIGNYINRSLRVTTAPRPVGAKIIIPSCPKKV